MPQLHYIKCTFYDYSSKVCLPPEVILHLYTLLTLKYGVNFQNMLVSSVLRQIFDFERDWQRVNAFSHCVYSDMRSTSANYLLLRYKRIGSCCYGM